MSVFDRVARRVAAVSCLLIAALAPQIPALAQESGDALPPSADSREAELDQRVRVLERKLELQAGEKAEKEKSTPKVTAGPEGFSFRSANGDFQLKLRGYVHVDGRYFFDDRDERQVDNFVIRRARPIVEGTLYKIFDFRIMPDFGSGTSSLQDAYLEARFSKALRLRAGKFKPPVGLERLQSATDLVFVERAFPTLLVPNRDVGIQLGGELLAGKLDYAVGIFNGTVLGGSGDGDSSDDKELAARLLWKPFQTDDGSVPPVDLAIGGAWTVGDHVGTVTGTNLPTLRSIGQDSMFSYRSDGTACGTAIADGERTRFAPQGWVYAGPFGAVAEWVSAEQRTRRGARVEDLDTDSWQLQLSWVLTGERNGQRGIVPRKPFSVANGGGGAWIVGARYSELEVDAAAFPFFADPARSVRRAETFGAVLSWNLVRGVRFVVDYDQTRFDGGAATGDRSDEKVLFTRFQVAF